MTIEEVLLEDAELTGFLRGQSETQENVVYRCIVKAGLADDQIVELAGVSLDFVKMVRINLNIL